ncbi:hypothetical protein 1013_scaffold3125_00091 [Bacteriophage sp.]|nr:hypothetical protein 1013_scaffold3125_00091 [Bacteriophage sp.]
MCAVANLKQNSRLLRYGTSLSRNDNNGDFTDKQLGVFFNPLCVGVILQRNAGIKCCSSHK